MLSLIEIAKSIYIAFVMIIKMAISVYSNNFLCPPPTPFVEGGAYCFAHISLRLPGYQLVSHILSNE